MTSEKKKLIAAAACFGAFILLIILLKTVDVKPIGPQNSSVGFAALNGAFLKLTKQNDAFYKFSEGIGFIALLSAAFFGFLGLLQLIKGKKLSAVDRDLYILGGFYVVVLAVYLIFEAAVVNYRPILEDGALAASFPSSHTMFGITLLGSAALQFKKRLADPRLRQIVISVCQLMVLLVVLLRLLSGWHWFTDVVGGILIGTALLLAYDVISERFGKA